jgi:FdhE protein
VQRTVRWVRHLIKLAAANVTPSLSLVTVNQESVLELMEAALCQDSTRVATLAQAIGAEPQVLLTIGHLSVLPLLQTCGQHLAPRVPSTWSAGYCPICGAWPALAEVRGLEHRRALRCARCGSDWRTTWLCCPFCGESDHRRLGVLMPEDNGTTRKIDVCTTCKGYVKTLTTLQAWPASIIPLEDLATIDLDVVALNRGYTRPARAAYYLATRLIVKSGHWRSMFGWRA